MTQLLTTDLWTTVSRLSRRAVKRAAIAYVSSDKHIAFGKNDQLVCDASVASIRSGQTDAKVLKRAFDRGAKIYSLPGLHAKVLLLDEQAIIGSANASSSSSARLVEAALLAEDPATVSLAQDFIDQLIGEASKLSEKKLDSLLKIDVKRNGFLPGNGQRKVRRLTRRTNRVWVIGTVDDDDDHPDEDEIADKFAEQLSTKLASRKSEVFHLRWTGSSRFRRLCKSGDWIIQMTRRSGVKKPTHVYPAMLVLERKEFDRSTRFFYVWPKSADEEWISWKSFKKLASNVGISRQITPNSEFEISEQHAEKLRILWGDQ